MSKYKKILVMLLIGSMVFQSAVPVSLAEELIKEESRENIGTDSLQQEAEIEFAEEETSPQNETEFQFEETEIFEETEFSKEEEEPIIEDTDILNAETNFSAETEETVEESENAKLLSEDILVEKIEAVEKIKLASNQSVMIDEEHFPDTEFREYVKEKFDTDEDDVLSAEEIENVTTIDLYWWSIDSLKGMEYFTNLKKLICPRDISELDVSGNVNLEYLACSFTDITELDVSNNVNLTYLDCSETEITKLNVSNDINLKKLDCSNTEITKLDVSSNVNLEELSCKKTKITELDVSDNINLKKLICSNTEMTKLDIGSGLTYLACNGTGITKLDVSGNTDLKELYCYDTEISELDVSRNVNLKRLSCSDTNITAVDVSNNEDLIYLSCSNTKIAELDVSSNANLTSLNCDNTKITRLDVHRNINLIYLFCRGTEIAELELSNNADLKELYCSKTKIIKLDLSNNKKLSWLECESTEIAELNLCNWNAEYIYLDLDNRSELTIYYDNDFFRKQISSYPSVNWVACVMINEVNFPDAEFCAYVRHKIDTNGDSLLVAEELEAVTEIKIDNQDIYDLTGIEYFTNLQHLTCNATKIKKLDVSKNTKLSDLACRNTGIMELNLCGWNGENLNLLIDNRSDLTVYFDNDYFVSMRSAYPLVNWIDRSTENVTIDEAHFPDAEFRTYVKAKFDTDGNDILSWKEIENVLEVSVTEETISSLKGIEYFVNLKTLKCASTGITKLDVSSNANLEYLYCPYIGITELDVSKNINLEYLQCNDTQIKELNIANNVKLETLQCSNTKITELNVSKNSNLLRLACSGTGITELDVSGNVKLKVLYCESIRITKLDVSSNVNLETLLCRESGITELDVSNNEKLISLNCSYTDIAELNISNNVNLGYLNCFETKITELNFCNWSGTSMDLHINNRADLTVYYANLGFTKLFRTYPLVNWVYRKKCEIHTWVCSSSTEATCKDSGLAKYECSVCGATKKEILPVKDVHVWGSWITTKNASCTEQGEKERICSVCQKKQTSVTPVLGHNMGAWTVTKNATALNKGEKQQQCTRCSYVKKSSIPKLTPTITVNAAALSLKCGQTTTALKVTGLAEGDSVASWKSSDTSVFTVSGKPNGTCTIAAGKQAKKTAKLTITLKSGLTKEIKISTQKKAVKATKITGVASKLTLKKGKTQTLKPILSPITSTEKIKFSSSNEKVATVTSGGKIKAVAAGKAVITVKAGSKSVKVTVIVPGIGNLKSSVTVKKGKNLTLSPKIYGISEKITYISSNRKVATVTEKGKIKGIKKGSAKITVQAGSYKKTVKVTVK